MLSLPPVPTPEIRPLPLRSFPDPGKFSPPSDPADLPHPSDLFPRWTREILFQIPASAALELHGRLRVFLPRGSSSPTPSPSFVSGEEQSWVPRPFPQWQRKPSAPLSADPRLPRPSSRYQIPAPKTDVARLFHPFQQQLRRPVVATRRFPHRQPRPRPRQFLSPLCQKPPDNLLFRALPRAASACSPTCAPSILAPFNRSLLSPLPHDDARSPPNPNHRSTRAYAALTE